MFAYVFTDTRDRLTDVMCVCCLMLRTEALTEIL
eukprot:COSAG01_NODE_70408_length_258_cov_1.591195_1_plen_33_part_01